MQRDANHLILPVGQIRAERFSKMAPVPTRIPYRPNKSAHAEKLKSSIDRIANNHSDGGTFIIKFNGHDETGLFFEQIELSTCGLELLSIKEKDGIVLSANVRVSSADKFRKLTESILKWGAAPYTKQNKYGQTIDNSSMAYIGSIEDMQDSPSLLDLFMDDISLFPIDENTHYWWELWLTTKNDSSKESAKRRFMDFATLNNMVFNPNVLLFRDRIVFLCNASKSALLSFIQNCDMIAEIRLAKKAIAPITDSLPIQQYELVQEILDKMTPAPNDDTRIVVLDENMVIRHPLLNDSLLRNNLQADTTTLSFNDSEHATGVSSLALFGDIDIASQQPRIKLTHKLESVQVINPNEQNPGVYGIRTETAVDLTKDNEHSAYVMALGEKTGDKHKGAPSLWSSYLDKVIFENRKTFAVSAGNFIEIIDPSGLNDWPKKTNHYQEQIKSTVLSPAQSWNSLTIGAYTELCNANACSHMGYTPFAQSGDLSPYSRTSCEFDKKWPIKPEVLFEGGNKVVDQNNEVFHSPQIFDLITCAHNNFRTNPFSIMQATSAATGLAGKFIGELMATYPKLWPETIRGLVVHSAEWTDAMELELGKAKYSELLRIFGFGVPNLLKAKYSAKNALTMIAEKEFNVYGEVPDKNGVTHTRKGTLKKTRCSQVMYIPLLWPRDLLESENFRDKKFNIKITLSYFVQPDPGERGYKNKYPYQSHRLRFDMQRPLESDTDFQTRINRFMNEDDDVQTEETPVSPSQSQNRLKWLYGISARTKGSIHKDILLNITGAELADMRNIAIYSTNGWWKNDKSAEIDTNTRFSLIVDVDAGDTEIDLYTPIKSTIESLTAISVQL